MNNVFNVEQTVEFSIKGFPFCPLKQRFCSTLKIKNKGLVKAKSVVVLLGIELTNINKENIFFFNSISFVLKCIQ